MILIPPLLRTRRFLPLFLTQFLGAFNDNVFKNALVMLITFKLTNITNADAQTMVTLAGGLFILPYLLFSATAGQLADKYDRAVIARYTKLAEILFMIAAAVGFYVNSLHWLMFVLFCMGTQATFFGPIKYALLPQHLHENELIGGNAYIEAGTFLAILIGTLSGGLLIMSDYGTHLISAAIILCAVLGYATSRAIPTAPAPQPSLALHWNIIAETWRMINNDRKNAHVFSCIIAISWFWLVGATFLSLFPAYAREVAIADETVVTLFLTVFSLGIGIGSFMCNLVLKGTITLKHVPAAALGISIFTADLYFANPQLRSTGALATVWQFLDNIGNWRIIGDLFGVSICAGLFIVPLYAVLQHDSDPKCRARTIASNNVVNALFMVLSAVATMVLLRVLNSATASECGNTTASSAFRLCTHPVRELFLIVSLLNVGVIPYTLKLSHRR